MRFSGLTDEGIKKELDKRTGIARPGAKEFLMDALAFAPAMLGMPMMGNVVKFPGKKVAKPRKKLVNPAKTRYKQTKSIERMEQYYNPDLKNPKITELPTAGTPKNKFTWMEENLAKGERLTKEELTDRLRKRNLTVAEPGHQPGYNDPRLLNHPSSLTKGTHFDSPLGKIKYDGFQEGFADVPGWYTYTMKEGHAKGASFSAKTQNPEDIFKAAKETAERFLKK